MAENVDRMQANQVVAELRASADRLAERSRQLADESLRLRQRADDIEQLVKQYDGRNT
jgi:hypothetical protein